jgi:hypothetical protein
MRFSTVTFAACLVSICLGAPSAASAKDLEEIDLAWGYDTEDNVLPGPVFEGLSAAPLRFEAIAAAYDKKAEVIRKIPGGFVRPLRYTLSPAIDLGALLTRALAEESVTLGLRSQPAGDAVVAKGRLVDFFMENRGVFNGAILFYGYLDVELELHFPDGRTQPLTGSFHGMYSRYNGGFGARDEAGEAIARFLVESAQEIVARIGQEALTAPPHPAILQLASDLATKGVENRYPELRRVGLSGLPEALPQLNAALARETEEDNRTAVLGAIANLGAPEALAILERAYATDQEDCRFAVFKALAYLDIAEARTLFARLAKTEREKSAQRFAAWWLARQNR